LRWDVTRYEVPQRLIFIEERKNRHDHLAALTEQMHPRRDRPPQMSVHIEHGDCRQVLISALAQRGVTTGPIFANLDGWGVDTPMSLVRHIGRMDTAEVLITFKPGWFWRFVNAPDPAAGDRVFGDSSWREIAREGIGEEKKRNLVSHYRDQLKVAGFPFQLAFELVDEGGRELFLVYGTGHTLGVEKMKNAMWKVDEVQGQRFRDPRDVNQLTMEVNESPALTVLKRQLLAILVSEGPKSLADLKEYTLLETIFRPAHTTDAVRELEYDGLVHRSKAPKHEHQIVSVSLLGYAENS
jgi:three-Cys-motif partner protein